MKILIVDDHSLFRAGLRLLLRDLAENLEVLEAECIQTGLTLALNHPDIDLILLDLQLQNINGLDGLPQFRHGFPASAVVLLSDVDAADLAAEGRAKGAQGFIPKTMTAEEMLDGLRSVLVGNLWFPHCALQPPTRIHLTPRQLEVLSRLCQGHSNKEIGRDLGLSENTVRTHVAVVFRTLGASTRTGAAMAAQRLALVHHIHID